MKKLLFFLLIIVPLTINAMDESMIDLGEKNHLDAEPALGAITLSETLNDIVRRGYIPQYSDFQLGYKPDYVVIRESPNFVMILSQESPNKIFRSNLTNENGLHILLFFDQDGAYTKWDEEPKVFLPEMTHLSAEEPVRLVDSGADAPRHHKNRVKANSILAFALHNKLKFGILLGFCGILALIANKYFKNVQESQVKIL